MLASQFKEQRRELIKNDAQVKERLDQLESRRQILIRQASFVSWEARGGPAVSAAYEVVAYSDWWQERWGVDVG